MRLWHKNLIPRLDDKRLIKQHSECCSFRGKLWQRGNYPGIPKDSDWGDLYNYHILVMDEMKKRGFKVNNEKWRTLSYRGEILKPFDGLMEKHLYIFEKAHNEEYLKSCEETILSKGGILK